MDSHPPTPLNLGIVAHVDAGKTSLTERLLHDAGLTTSLGSVDAGTTLTDSMALERQRGITIRAAVTSFAIGDLTLNLLDTPGHPDFIAEVERSLAVLDGAVLVLSAVEGVQPQSVVIFRALQRLGVPTVIFINKIDRSGADVDAVLSRVRGRLQPMAPLLTTVTGVGTAEAAVRALSLTDDSVLGVLAEADDALLARWVRGAAISPGRVRRRLRQAIGTGRATPVLCGSALTGAGMDQLRAVLRELIPRPRPRATAPAATVFAVERTPQGRRSWLRVWSGSLAVRTRVSLGAGRPRPLTWVAVSRPGGEVEGVAHAGDLVAVRGIEARIGDSFGPVPTRPPPEFPPPVLQTLVEPVDPTQRSALFAALTELADQDPLIGLHLNQLDGQASLSLHGEVQREVIAARLTDEYRVPTRWSRTGVRCIERLRGVGEATVAMGEPGNPYLAGLGIRIEPRPSGHPVSFDPGIEPGRLTRGFISATEETVRDSLRHGLAGWQVEDCHVALFWSQFSAPSSVAADFRGLTPRVLTQALQRAGTVVCEPIEQLTIELPSAAMGTVIEQLGRTGGVVTSAEPVGQGGHSLLVAELATRQVPALAQALPDLTGGEGVLERRVHHHAAVRGTAPSRPAHR